ncbi:MAG: heliorhodopsin HeR [Candidatus Dojkabacteria bacterium]|nr:heliorhodopsin HeR [Candidatus Dojkabacteria bacterium]MDQ7020372.1 heliorhodopsin HeR [Candidatus Dojkabacteria bacterium]
MFKSFTESENRFRNLRIFNLVMGFFHLAQAVIMLMISNDYTQTLTTSFIKGVQTGEREFVFSTKPENFIDINLGAAVAVFLFLSAAAHFLLASPMFYNWYVNNLKKGVNYGRWIEYSLSSSWMIIIIAILTGMLDAPSLLLMASLNAMMILFGYVMELHNQTTEKTDWTSFVFGCIAGAIPWVIIAWYFISAVTNFEGENPIPKFVYGILISLFVFFNIFAINMYLQYKKVGPWKNYLFGETVFIIKSHKYVKGHLC